MKGFNKLLEVTSDESQVNDEDSLVNPKWERRAIKHLTIERQGK